MLCPVLLLVLTRGGPPSLPPSHPCLLRYRSGLAQLLDVVPLPKEEAAAGKKRKVRGTCHGRGWGQGRLWCGGGVGDSVVFHHDETFWCVE